MLKLLSLLIILSSLLSSCDSAVMSNDKRLKTNVQSSMAQSSKFNGSKFNGSKFNGSKFNGSKKIIPNF